MITIEEALSQIRDTVKPLDSEMITLGEATGRVLAEPLIARIDSPRFDNTAVDGYAIRFGPSPDYRLGETIQAGSLPSYSLGSGEAARVLTGAPLPDGTDAVVMQEDAELFTDSIQFSKAPKAGDHIRQKGEEYKTGDLLLDNGSAITPPLIGLLATQGLTRINVRRKPRVGVLVTGNELVALGELLGDAQIYESNSWMIEAGCKALGLDHIARKTATDDVESIKEQAGQLLKDHDILITCGGVSVGDYDLVKDVFVQLGIEKKFWQVAIKPGKPIFFGTAGNKMVFGLPGNPVSAMVTFKVFVEPAIRAMLGLPWVELDEIRAKLTQKIKKQPGRHELMRGIWRRGEVTPVRGQESNMIGGLAIANCLIHFPTNQTEIDAGEKVAVTPLQWSLI